MLRYRHDERRPMSMSTPSDALRRFIAQAIAAHEAVAARLGLNATHGGILDDAYLAPLGQVARARLVLATGAPRLNLGASALGQQVRMVAETAATRLTLRAAKPGGELIR